MKRGWLAFVLLILKTIAVMAQDRPTKDLTKAFKGETITRERPAEKPSKPEKSGPPGNVGGRNENGESNKINNSPATQVTNMPPPGQVTVDALNRLKGIKTFALILGGLIPINDVINAIKSGKGFLEWGGALQETDMKDAGKQLSDLAYAEKAAVERVIRETALETSQNFDEANRTNSPDKEERKRERDFWNRLNNQCILPVINGEYSHMENVGVEIKYEANPFSKNTEKQLHVILKGILANEGLWRTTMDLYIYEIDTNAVGFSGLDENLFEKKYTLSGWLPSNNNKIKEDIILSKMRNLYFDRQALKLTSGKHILQVAIGFDRIKLNNEEVAVPNSWRMSDKLEIEVE